MVPFLIISWVALIVVSYKLSVKVLEKAGKL
jgi:hypothetical protein